MKIEGELTRWRQLLGLVGLAGGYHLVKLAGNLIDKEEGVFEQHVGRLFARRVLSHVGLEVEVAGTEKVAALGSYCIASTHASYLDWAVLLGYFPSPIRFVAKKELLALPVIGDYLRLRAVLIDRRKGQDAKVAIRTAARDGVPWPILIFPEGTRSRDGSIQPFKKGGLRVLAEEGCSILPVRIDGTFHAFSRDARFIRSPGTLRMTICDPVPPDFGGSPDAAIDEAERRIRAVASR